MKDNRIATCKVCGQEYPYSNTKATCNKRYCILLWDNYLVSSFLLLGGIVLLWAVSTVALYVASSLLFNGSLWALLSFSTAPIAIIVAEMVLRKHRKSFYFQS